MKVRRQIVKKDGVEMVLRIESPREGTFKSYLAGELCAIGTTVAQVAAAARKSYSLNPKFYHRAQARLDEEGSSDDSRDSAERKDVRLRGEPEDGNNVDAGGDPEDRTGA